ncbi:MAG: RNA methyltransferase, partial [Rhodospirillaceae bacterium]|nr:RNA methyltransferase [Rhodospirillaceae bacterium]
MSGTDTTKESITPLGGGGGPAVVLVESQLAENIGTAARAMYNCGLTDMRLVKPKQDWLSEKALAASSGASEVLKSAGFYESTEDAIADLEFIAATTARPRDMVKTVWTPHHAGGELATRATAGTKIGILFGREKSGLKNHDIGLADVIIEAPLNPAYSSLNLAQAVLIVAYEWYQASQASEAETIPYGITRPANKDELNLLFQHLEYELDTCGFLHVEEKRPSMVLNIRTMLQRAALTEQEVRTLHGVVTELRYGRR